MTGRNETLKRQSIQVFRCVGSFVRTSGSLIWKCQIEGFVNHCLKGLFLPCCDEQNAVQTPPRVKRLKYAATGRAILFLCISIIGAMKERDVGVQVDRKENAAEWFRCVKERLTNQHWVNAEKWSDQELRRRNCLATWDEDPAVRSTEMLTRLLPSPN